MFLNQLFKNVSTNVFLNPEIELKHFLFFYELNSKKTRRVLKEVLLVLLIQLHILY